MGVEEGQGGGEVEEPAEGEEIGVRRGRGVEGYGMGVRV